VGNHVVSNFPTVNANPALDKLIANNSVPLSRQRDSLCDRGTPGFASKRADCNFTDVRNRETQRGPGTTDCRVNSACKTGTV